jgi:uncharacterized protein YjiS (DUF1127 family)
MLSNKKIPLEINNFNSIINPVGDAIISKTIIDNLRIIKISKTIGRIAKGLIVSVIQLTYRNSVRRELNTMPDYLLLDIGVQRDQINGIVSGRISRKSIGHPIAVDHTSRISYEDHDDTPLAA